jgi:hypothetical protein
MMACHYPSEYNACLTIEYAGSGRWAVVAGLDRWMPRWLAVAIIQCPSSGSFSATLWGDDGSDLRDFLGYLWIKDYFPSAPSNPDSLSAEFSSGYAEILDEDPAGDGDGRDEVYAEITYYDCYYHMPVVHRTGTHIGYF